jgi:DNA-directed RNA polymerase subunit L
MGKKKTTGKGGFEEMLEEQLANAPAEDSETIKSDLHYTTETTSLTNDEIQQKLSAQVNEDVRTGYKYLDVRIDEVVKNEYKIAIYNQSHGFCNFLISKLLNINGVLFAAYKKTSLEPASVDLRIEAGKDVKKILKEGIDKMRDDLKMMQKLVADSKF